MNIHLRKGSFLVLVLLFFVQTALVYTDPTGRSTAPLTDLGRHGRKIWHEHNCQSCHQLYGFGGFLGPDLTNSNGKMTQARIDQILTEGAMQMPAFHLDEGERRALMGFLEEVGATGVGQFNPPPGSKPADVLEQAIDAAVRGGASGLSEAQARGRDLLIAQNCLSCHLPNPFAQKKATDLTGLVPKLGTQGAAAIIALGIASKGMPAFALEPSQQEDLTAFLGWLAANAQSVQETFRTVSTPPGAATLPWFEYPR